MDPTQNTSPDESALPNVSPQSSTSTGAAVDQFAVQQVPPIADSPMPAAGQPKGSTTQAAFSDATAPLTPPPALASPPVDGGGWLPPTVSLAPPPSGGASPASGQDSTNQSAAAPAVNVAAPAVADDGDIIEKEWVEKAKQIVERTRQDPYNQTRELHKFKAEYLQKRYNKTIEAVEE